MKNSVFIIFLISACFLLVTLKAYGQIEIFLYPIVNTDKQQLQLLDVARIVGDEASSAAISAIPIEPSYYADRLIDRSEIRLILHNAVSDNLRIYGSAVRIRNISPVINQSDFHTKVHRDRIKSGEKVTVIIRKNGIMIQSLATAIESGKSGDIIRVKLKDTRKIKGRISREGDIEVWM
jgi:hypothetical protein